MPIENPNNRYLPPVGAVVKVIGGCHPAILNQFAQVSHISYPKPNEDPNRIFIEIELEDGCLTSGLWGNLVAADYSELKDSNSRFIEKYKAVV